MRVRGIVGTFLCVILAGTLSSCATTKLRTSWVAPEASGKKLESVLILGIAKNVAIRRQFEENFASMLTKRQVRAMTSYTKLPNAAAIDEAAVKPIVEQGKITHVLVVRLVNRESVTSYVPGTTAYVGGYPGYYPSYYNSWSGYYAMSYSVVTSPGYSYETEYVNLETNVYEVASGKLVWTGLTETELGGEAQEQIGEFIGVISSAMIHDKLI